MQKELNRNVKRRKVKCKKSERKQEKRKRNKEKRMKEIKEVKEVKFDILTVRHAEQSLDVFSLIRTAIDLLPEDLLM